ncbi:PilZ domain-containing protein [Altererythrobacter sp. H2]|uniref:PilZ domain-containing protein n=1 Tax=Altererythrobacter sp. H2 TaxID=3108391 RepID=UPI002B4C019C|nr:PilZ domain-containing protein [Altererythrobacter sp. H2]WRK95897.1 PilZ domain-containing protein [Altererythrobacter sp. H2]
MERGVLETVIRASGPGSEELRAAPRVTLLIRPAKLAMPEGEFVCVIRDVSASGVSVRMFHPLPMGEAAVLETETGMRVTMHRVWDRDNEAGFQFEEPIDVAALVNEIGSYRKRKLRIGIDLPVNLAVLGQKHPAMIRNLSQQGARIECDVRLALIQMVRLESGYLPEIRAKVRWRRDSQFGLVFEDTFSLGDFAQIAARLQSPSLLSR